MYRSGTRLEFESISWMLMAHCRIANQGRSSLSTASILTPLDPSRRRSHDMKSDKWWLGTISCIYDMQWFMPCKTCNLHAPIRMLNRLRIRVRFEKNISSIVRNAPKTDVNVQNSSKVRIPRGTIITPNCQLFGGDIPPSWVTYLFKTFWESPWVTLC